MLAYNYVFLEDISCMFNLLDTEYFLEICQNFVENLQYPQLDVCRFFNRTVECYQSLKDQENPNLS